MYFIRVFRFLLKSVLSHTNYELKKKERLLLICEWRTLQNSVPISSAKLHVLHIPPSSSRKRSQTENKFFEKHSFMEVLCKEIFHFIVKNSGGTADHDREEKGSLSTYDLKIELIRAINNFSVTIETSFLRIFLFENDDLKWQGELISFNQISLALFHFSTIKVMFFDST